MKKRQMKKEMKKISSYIKSIQFNEKNIVISSRSQGKTLMLRKLLRLIIIHEKLYSKLCKNNKKWVKNEAQYILLDDAFSMHD